MAAATALTALIAGSRASFGLFLSPINTATGLGMAQISLAAAVGQLAAGLALSRRAPSDERGLASGIVGAGGPAGQLLFAPLVT